MTPGSQNHVQRFSGVDDRPALRSSPMPLADNEDEERTVVDFFAPQRARSSSSYPDAVTTPLTFAGAAKRSSAFPPAEPEEPSFHRATPPSLVPLTDDDRPTLVQRPRAPVFASVLPPSLAPKSAKGEQSREGSSIWRTASITTLAAVAFAICFVGVTSAIGPPPPSLGFLGPLAKSPLFRSASAAIANVTGSPLSVPARSAAPPPPAAAPAPPADDRTAAEALLSSLAAAHPADDSYREAARIVREGGKH
jgi:hypothetical protein